MRAARGSFFGILAFVALCGASFHSSASLLGDSITGCLGNAVFSCSPNFFSSATATVADPGVEFSGSLADDIVGANFGGPSGTTLTIAFRHLSTHSGTHGYFGFGMDFSGIDDTVVGLTLLAGSTLPISAFSFGAHSIDIEFTTVSFPVGDSTQTAVFQLSTVPEPSVLALLGAAALTLSLARARRKSSGR